jgi:UDPglucose--hexose-1-phosphate uridylyltransferase
MPELRKDPLVGRWVIISTERAKRPDEFLDLENAEQEPPQQECPFCEGHEAKTRPEIAAHRTPGSAPNGPGWNVRVIPSIAPVLQIEGNLEQKTNGLHQVTTGIGAHEIIIENPKHVHSVADMPEEQIRRIIDVSIDRIVDLEKDTRFTYVLLFKNHGTEAGEGQFHHSRSQLIALPVNPIRVREELTGARNYFREKERCLFCDMVKQELESRERIAAETPYFVAVTPFASRFPFELWILPKNHCADFTKLPEAERADLAVMLKLAQSKITHVLHDPPVNTILHTAPFRRGRPGDWGTIDADFHWHIEIVPRLTRVAGFEWGSGFYINPFTPEEAARFLREQKQQVEVSPSAGLA